MLEFGISETLRWISPMEINYGTQFWKLAWTYFQYCSTGDSVKFSERPCFKKASDWLNVMLPSGLKHLLLAQVPSEKKRGKIAIFVQKLGDVGCQSGIIDIKFQK